MKAAVVKSREFTPVGQFEFRIWFFCILGKDLRSFRQTTRQIVKTYADKPGFERASFRFALIDDSGGVNSWINDLATLPDITIVRTPKPIGPDKALVHGLRCLRGTVREEDVVVTIPTTDGLRSGDLQSLLLPLVQEYYDPRKLVVRDNGYTAHRGWMVQFELKREEFNDGLHAGIELVDLPRKKIVWESRGNSSVVPLNSLHPDLSVNPVGTDKENRARTAGLVPDMKTPEQSPPERRWTSWRSFSVSLFMAAWFATIILFLMSPAYGAIVKLLHQ